MHSPSVILQLTVVLCDCIFVFHVPFVCVVCDWSMCAATDLSVLCVYNVNCDTVSKVP